jgi:hypothetical protein
MYTPYLNKCKQVSYEWDFGVIVIVRARALGGYYVPEEHVKLTNENTQHRRWS